MNLLSMEIKRVLFLLWIVSFICNESYGQLEQSILESIQFRNLGPAYMTGRISDIVKDPNDPSTWYVATGSSNLWKTKNNGTTWKPIFDQYPAYSTGCITLDPSNSNIVWLGTGENQSQRSVGWGDGIYRSLDGGDSWENMGLYQSEHIGKILIDPRDSDIMLVAAQGPLWKSGGDRGIYRSEDGGATWERVLFVSENTGAAEVLFDPANPDIVYATTYQRRRHVGILVAGGPESRIYKSTDNGKTWRQLQNGLPQGDLGRIALAVSPQDPDVVYAQLVGKDGASGFYRSENRGESWTKKSDYTIVDPQYYGEIYCDPHRFDHVYVMDVHIHFTTNGGGSFEPLNSTFKHVDNHSLLFDPSDENYMMVGCDGGIYETWDRGDTWKFHDNLPIVQFYRVGVDNDFPFYHVYGGTQDNSTLYAPSATITRHGIRNADWKLALGGDGFQARIDPGDPNTVYCQSQYAGIVRYDRSSGQRTEIQPQISHGEDPLRWHWDSPLIISPHDPKRLYFAAQKLFRSDDRGDHWISVSDDLSRGNDRNQREVMGQVWPPEAVWKNVFTSPYGTIVSLSESTLEEGLIVAGTDDGLIQVTEDGGETWKIIDDFPGVPPKAYVADVITSMHDRNVIFAVFNHHKEGDFTPYVVKTHDLGETWQLITEGIDPPHACWSIVQDHEFADLLFLGSEFGLFCSIDGGLTWVRMKGGLPTIPFRDLEIQRRENDLVCATFGRGMWILDNYSFLRTLITNREESARLFPVKDAWSYVPKGDMGYSVKGVFGDAFYTAGNKELGPEIDLYLDRKISTLYDMRKQEYTGETYPSYGELKAEDMEEIPQVLAIVRDTEDNFVSKTVIPNRKGYQRVALEMSRSIYSEDEKVSRRGPKPVEGLFRVQLYKNHRGELTIISEAKEFKVTYLPVSDEQPSDDYYTFHTANTQLLVEAIALRDHIKSALSELKVHLAIAIQEGSKERIQGLEQTRLGLYDLIYALDGDQTLQKRENYAHPGIIGRLNRIYRNQNSSFQITGTHRESHEWAKGKLDRIRTLFNELKAGI